MQEIRISQAANLILCDFSPTANQRQLRNFIYLYINQIQYGFTKKMDFFLSLSSSLNKLFNSEFCL